MRALLFLSLLSLGACSIVEGDPFSDPLLSVYEITLETRSGADDLQGTLALTFIFNDAITPGCGTTGGFDGRWKLDGGGERVPEGKGDVGGSLECDGRTVRLYLFSGDKSDEGVLYELVGEQDGELFSGTWDRVGQYPNGTFAATRVREATEFVSVP